MTTGVTSEGAVLVLVQNLDRERIYLKGRTEVERSNGGEGRGRRGGCRRGCRLKPGARTARENRAGRAGSS